MGAPVAVYPTTGERAGAGAGAGVVVMGGV